MGSKPNWTTAETDYLEERWGNTSIPHIAKTLGKSINAIKLKAGKIGLDTFLQSGEEITFLDLCKALGRPNNYGYWSTSWVTHGFPMKYKKVITKKFMVVNIAAFWKWAEKHKYLVNFAKFETNTLGKEPKWVPIKRRADVEAAKYKTTPWTKAEDNHLISLLNTYKYGYREISIRLSRTEGAIKRRVCDLKLKQRPIKAENHTPWTDNEIQTVFTMVEKGYKPQVIAEYIDRSACAIRGLLERTFGTEVYKMELKA